MTSLNSLIVKLLLDHVETTSETTTKRNLACNIRPTLKMARMSTDDGENGVGLDG